jgi:hypothetical protein
MTTSQIFIGDKVRNSAGAAALALRWKIAFLRRKNLEGTHLLPVLDLHKSSKHTTGGVNSPLSFDGGGGGLRTELRLKYGHRS